MQILKWWRYFRDWALRKGLRWSWVAKFMRTRIAQAAAAIPLIGYALLWSQELSGYFVLRSVLGTGILFDTTERLLLIYYGALFLAAAWAVYLYWCPAPIKRNPEMDTYLFQEIQAHNQIEFRRIQTLMGLLVTQVNETQWGWAPNAPVTLTGERTALSLSSAARRHNYTAEQQSTVLQAYFLASEAQAFPALVAASLMAAIGTILILLPSLEVFLLVGKKVLLPTLGL